MNTKFRQWMLGALAASVMVLQGPAVAQENTPSPEKTVEPSAAGESVERESTPSVEVEPTGVERANPESSTDESQHAKHRHHGISVHTNTGNSVVHIGSDSHLAASNTAETVIAVGGSSFSEGTVTDAVVAIMGDARATGDVGDTVVAIMGNTYVNSKVGGDVVAVFGNVELGPEADVHGDVVSIGGTIIRDPAANVHGAVNEVSVPVHVGQLEWLRPWVRHALLYGRPLAVDDGLGWAWALALGFLAFYALLAVMFPAGIRRGVRTLEAHPAASFFTALLSLLIAPMLVLVLLITVIGIAVLPFLWFALFFMGLFGKAVILAAIGQRVIGSIEEGPTIRVPAAVLVGGGILLVFYLVPIIGNILYMFTGFLGFGVVAYALLQETKAKRAPRYNGGAPGMGPTSTPPPASPPVSPEASFSSQLPLPSLRVEPRLRNSEFDDARNQESRSSESTSGAAPPGAEEPTVSATNSTSTNSTATPGQTVPLATAAASFARASFLVRMGALAIDLLLVSVIVNNLFDHAEVFGMVLVPLAIYGAVMWKLKGTTIGGIVCNLQVVRLDGREIDWATAIVRALGCFLSMIAAGLGFLWMLFDSERQTWHDKIAGTVVVRVPKGTSLV